MDNEHESDIDVFVNMVSQRFPDAKINLDSPKYETGTWWIDISVQSFRVSVMWQANFGFGIFSSADDGYDDRPDEHYTSPITAADRIIQMLDAMSVHPMWLREIRGLVGVQQVSLAKKLNINQAAISRVESRCDVKLSTLQAYLGALGGHIEMRVLFDNFEAGIAMPLPDFTEEA